METLSRRHALYLLAALGGVSLLPTAARTAGGVELTASLAQLLAKLDLESAARIGRAYLQRYPDDGDVQRMLDTLPSDSETFTDISSFLSRKVRDDFAQRRVVEVEDWQISSTEARIFAAIALTA
jgi:hypothetical protein